MAGSHRDPQTLGNAISSALGIGDDTPPTQATQIYRGALQRSVEQMEQLLGRLGAQAVVNHSIRITSNSRPEVAVVKMSEGKVDISELEAMARASTESPALHLHLEALLLTIFVTLNELTGNVITSLLIENFRTKPADIKE